LASVRTETKKATERTEVEVMRESLSNIQGGLLSFFCAADGIVQTSKLIFSKPVMSTETADALQTRVEWSPWRCHLMLY